MRTRRWLLVVSAGLLTAAGLAGCTGPDGGAGNDDAIRVLTVDQRKQPVALSGTTLEGRRLDLASYRGKLVVLNVWGSWCGPCHAEAPDLQAASEQLAPRGVAMIGINARESDPSQAMAFQRSYEITYPSLSDQDGTLLLALRGAVAPNAIPSTLVLDRDGRIAARISGAVTRPTLVAVVEEVEGVAGAPSASVPSSSAPPSAASSSAPVGSGS